MFFQVSTLHPSVVTEGHGRLRCPRMCHLSHQQRTHLLCPFASKLVRQILSYHNGHGEMEKPAISEGQKNMKEDDSAAPRPKGSEGDYVSLHVENDTVGTL